jgi:hypothetical protein
MRGQRSALGRRHQQLVLGRQPPAFDMEVEPTFATVLSHYLDRAARRVLIADTRINPHAIDTPRCVAGAKPSTSPPGE